MTPRDQARGSNRLGVHRRFGREDQPRSCHVVPNTDPTEALHG